MTGLLAPISSLCRIAFRNCYERGAQTGARVRATWIALQSGSWTNRLSATMFTDQANRFLVRLWTSAHRSQCTDNREFCAILNEVIRDDDPSTLRHAVTLCRGINEFLTSSRSSTSGIVWPQGPDAVGPSKSTTRNATYRVSGMPIDALRDFYRQLIDKKFRSRMFLATSFSRDKAIDTFMPMVPTGRVAVLTVVHIDSVRKTMSARYLESLTHCADEAEFLYVPYSVFTVRRVREPVEDANYWVVELDAAVDGKDETEDLPLAPWC